MICFYFSLFAIVLVVMIISFLVCVVSKTFDLTYNYICDIKSQLWSLTVKSLMNEWSNLVADELVGWYCLPILTISTADSSIHTYRPIRLRYAIQSRERCLIVDFVFPFSSLETFALGCIDINFSYASPVCWLCFCEREHVHVWV